tara:strand:+ start:212 stop:1084 length:873 start_codon:yes stop_codon:yes gene_type:complete
MKKIKILIPIYNDWKSAFKLLENIDTQISKLNFEFSVIIVNDGSTEQKPEIFLKLHHLKSIKIINMKKNKGHGRCNAAGLKYVFENEDFDYIIPMDGDGEDRPEEIKEFTDKIKDSPDLPVVGERIKRSENIIFKFCYEIHKILTLTFTGKSIKFGHFTCLPKLIVQEMLKEKATWNCFSGSLVKITSKKNTISSIRGIRYFDQSKMSFLNLVMHSFSIMSVFRLTALFRSILFVILYFFLIYNNISIITLIPIPIIIIFVMMLFSLSKRENLDELNNSLENINNIENLK